MRLFSVPGKRLHVMYLGLLFYCHLTPISGATCPAYDFSIYDGIEMCECDRGYSSEFIRIEMSGSPTYECEPCLEGQYKNFVGNDYCEYVPDNGVSNSDKTDFLCLPNYEKVSDACNACPAGTEKLGTNSNQCIIVPEQLTCIACEENHYLNPVGVCQECPENSHTPYNVNASSINNCLCGRGYTNSSASACEPCPFNTFKPTGATNVTCTQCPLHSVTIGTGSHIITECYCDKGFEMESTIVDQVLIETCEACQAGKFKGHVADPTPPGPVTYQLEYDSGSGKYALDGELSPSLIIYRGIPTTIKWPSSSHPLYITAFDQWQGELYAQVQIDNTLLQTNITYVEGPDTVVLYYYCNQHPGMGVNQLTILSPSHEEAPCEPCPQNFYCPIQTMDPVACPVESTSASGSEDIHDCHCGAGFYAEFSSNGDDTTLTCQPCPLGTYNNETNQQQCQACPPGTFNPSTGASSVGECQACPLNSDSSLGSTAISDCKCLAGFSGDPGNECVACPPGFYRSNMSEYICSACPINTYNVLDSSTNVGACLSCPENTKSAAGSGVQADCICDPGFYASSATDSGAWVCTPCAAGSYSTASNSSACELCPAGTYSTATGASTPNSCLLCNDGSYALSAGTVVCSLCPFSTWQDTSGNAYTSMECTPCPSHSFHGINGSVDIHDCICGAEYYKVAVPDLEQSNFTCELCPAADRCPGDNQNYSCPVNHYAVTGSSLCTECQEDSQGMFAYGLVSDQQCQCIAGYEGTSGDSCWECSPGKYQPHDYTYDSTDTALREVVESQASELGYESVIAVELLCLDCPIGTYCDSMGTIIPTPCPSNSSSILQSDDKTDCTCNPGFYGPSGGPCIQCPSNSFCIGGLPEHQPCHAHTTSIAGSDNSADCKCVAGYYSTISGGDCLKCPAGNYCPGDQAVNACSSNSSSLNGMGVIEQCICDPGQWRGCILLQDGSGNAVDATGQICVIDYTQPCTDCGEDFICLNNTLIHCPEHSEAPAGSHDSDACTCVDGYFNHAVGQDDHENDHSHEHDNDHDHEHDNDHDD